MHSSIKRCAEYIGALPKVGIKLTMRLDIDLEVEGRLGPLVSRYRYDKKRALRDSLVRLGFFWACGLFGIFHIVGKLMGENPDSTRYTLALTMVSVALAWLTYQWGFAQNFCRVSYGVYQEGFTLEVKGRKPHVIPFSEVSWVKKTRLDLVVKLAGFRMVRVHPQWIQREDGDPVEGIHQQYEEWKRQKTPASTSPPTAATAPR